MIYDRECLCPIGKKIQPPSLPHIPRQELATNQHRPSDGKEQEHLADVARLVYLLAPLSLSPSTQPPSSSPHPPSGELYLRSISLPSLILSSDENIIFVGILF